MNRQSLPIVVLISGGGTTLRNLLQAVDAGQLSTEVRAVISSRAEAGGLRWAEEAGIPREVIRRRDCASAQAFSDLTFAACRAAGAELVVMGGYLQHVLIPQDFVNRVLNIHPSLIPAFCGHGYYGLRVHQAVLDYGAKVSGCTVHFVDNQYDHGPIVAQQAVPVLPEDTAETLAARVFAAECQLYPQAIDLFARGQLRVRGRRVEQLCTWCRNH